MARYLRNPLAWEMEVISQQESIEFPGEFSPSNEPFDFVIKHYGEPVLIIRSAKEIKMSQVGIRDLNLLLQELNTVRSGS